MTLKQKWKQKAKFVKKKKTIGSVGGERMNHGGEAARRRWETTSVRGSVYMNLWSGKKVWRVRWCSSDCVSCPLLASHLQPAPLLLHTQHHPESKLLRGWSPHTFTPTSLPSGDSLFFVCLFVCFDQLCLRRKIQPVFQEVLSTSGRPTNFKALKIRRLLEMEMMRWSNWVGRPWRPWLSCRLKRLKVAPKLNPWLKIRHLKYAKVMQSPSAAQVAFLQRRKRRQ